jgi:hypothetical protein
MSNEWKTLGVRQGGMVTQARQIGEDEFEIRHVQDIASHLEANKAMRNHNDGYSQSREFRRVASIPPVVIEMWKNEGIDVFNPDHQEAVMRKLNDPDYGLLRTADGTLGISNGVIR